MMPVLALGADKGVGTVLVETMRKAAANVQGAVLKSCGHYMPEEAPWEVARLIGGFFAGKV